MVKIDSNNGRSLSSHSCGTVVSWPWGERPTAVGKAFHGRGTIKTAVSYRFFLVEERQTDALKEKTT